MLERMTVGELHERYVEIFGESVRSRHKRYLMRRIGWRCRPSPRAGVAIAPASGDAETAFQRAGRGMRACGGGLTIRYTPGCVAS